MITFIGKRNASDAEDRQALGIAMEVVDRANRAAAGIRVVAAKPERRTWSWCLHLTTVTCSEPVKLAFGPGFIAVREPQSTDVVDHVHMHVVVAQVVMAWRAAGLCEDVRDTRRYIEERSWIALLDRSLKELGATLTGWPFTPFMFSLDTPPAVAG